MRVKIIAELSKLSPNGPNDVISTSNQTPTSKETVETGKNLGDLRNLAKEVVFLKIVIMFNAFFGC